MTNDPYTALNLILQSNSNITSLLGKYQGTDIPLIKGGILAETETGLPAIVFNNDNFIPKFNIEDSVFTVNCYATTERDSFLLAKTVTKELQANQTTANGYPVTTSARILAVIPDPASKEVNTAVEVRLFNIGGAI